MSDTEGALSPPPTVVPNFSHPEDALNTINLVTQVLVISIITILTFLRIYIRTMIQKTFYKEDWTCVAAWVMYLVYSGSAILMGIFGGGHHQWEVTKAEMRDFMKVVYGGSISYGPTTYLIKVTLLLILTRVFAPFKKTVRFIYVFMILMLGYYLPVVIIKSRMCMPIPGFWDPRVTASCFDQHALFLADTVISVVTDVSILVIPIPLVWAVKMPLKKKFKVLGLLGGGGIATAASIARLVMVVQLGNSPDLTYSIIRFNLLG
ncbi:hypothetical protein BP5796_09326 [Coleophoma crateriformis]|uniref:Rhodopsin domain-containing protein n=1 Tax=Coleophoma crateriformis TaxID=565419 RepID=A0A3D8R3T4_9HELO|nr:hypothetical protein BP5796_09326 [Coleophoma crateriformis]